MRTEPLSLEEKAVAFSIGSLLASYPPDDQSARLAALTDIGAQCQIFPGGTPAFLGEFMQPDALDDLRSAYIAVFDRAGRFNPLYESAYGHGQTLGKGNTLADIAGFYLAFGWNPDGDGAATEMVDHVGVELEFYALMLLQEAELAARGNAEGAGIVHDARKKFLEDHLGRIGAAVAQRQEVQAHPVFGAFFAWLRGVVLEECAELNVAPRPLDLSEQAPPPDDDPTACGNLRLPVLS